MEEISAGDTGKPEMTRECSFRKPTLRDFLFNTIESFQCHWNEETFETGASIENNGKRKGGFLFDRLLDDLFFFLSLKQNVS